MTGNKGKFREAEAVLSHYNIKLEQFPGKYPEIRADDVEDVAKASAQAIFADLKTPLVVEDAGLFIPALNDFPGAYSAWVQKKLGNAGILKLLEGKKDRSAYFKACVAYADSNGVKTFTGIVQGTIAEQETGNLGFGYDPIFVPQNEKETFAESETLKNRISHRTNAFTAFARWYTTYTK